MSKDLNLQNLIGKTALIECDDSDIYKVIEEIYSSFGVSVSKIKDPHEEEFIVPDFYCVVSSVQGSYQHVHASKFNFNRVKEVADLIKENKKGKMILITNDLGERVITTKFPKESSMQAKIIHWWKVIAADVAENGVNSNIISLGYAPFFKNEMDKEKEEKLMKMLLVKRFVKKEDLKDALFFLSCSDSRYMVGQTIKLDGGFHLHPMKRLKGEEVLKIDNTLDLTGKTALVIGASSGMGKETAIELAKRGADLVLMSRNEEKLELVAKEIKEFNSKVLIKAADVTKKKELAESIRDSWNLMRGIDVLVYCTGCFVTELLYKDNSLWDKVMATNFTGYTIAVMEFIKLCIKNKKAGTIVGTASVGATDIPVINSEAYIASKAAMLKFSCSIAESYSRSGIRINCVAPGCIDTPMISCVTDEYIGYWLENIPMGRLGKPDDISNVIAYLASSASSYITGSVIAVDGGFLLNKLNMF